MPGQPINIVVVDDHPVVRDGLRGQLGTATGVAVVAEAASTEEALAVLRNRDVDVLIADLRMPGLGGVELIRRVRADYPTIKIIVLTTYDTDADVTPALAAGAHGYLLKDAGRQAVVSAVHAVLRGETVLSPSIRSRPVGSPSQAPPGSVLSARELEVLRLVAAGSTNAHIGQALFIGEATVKTHLQHIFTKLDVPDRAAAVASALRRGYL